MSAIAVLTLILPAQAARKHIAGVKYEDVTIKQSKVTSKKQGKTGATTNRVRNDPYKNFKF